MANIKRIAQDLQSGLTLEESSIFGLYEGKGVLNLLTPVSYWQV